MSIAFPCLFEVCFYRLRSSKSVDTLTLDNHHDKIKINVCLIVMSFRSVRADFKCTFFVLTGIKLCKLE